MQDDRAQFRQIQSDLARGIAGDRDLQRLGTLVTEAADRLGYSYVWTWLGVPVIQVPADIVATQEVIWNCRPQVIIETGIARGGSLILYSSILELIGEGTVIGVDIDIRAHNRRTIEGHPLSKRISMIEGSSVDATVIADVRNRIEGLERVMVLLDSNHTHEHVLSELRAYGPMVSPGQYLIVMDTIVEHIAPQTHRPRPWGPGNNPATSVAEYLSETDRFVVDEELNGKLLISSSRGGYLRCVAPTGQ